MPRLGHSNACTIRYIMSEQCLLQVMERRQAAAEEAEEQGSEGSGRDTGLSHRSSSEPPVTMLVQKLQDQRLSSLNAVKGLCFTSTGTKLVENAEQVASFVSLAYGPCWQMRGHKRLSASCRTK